MRAVDLARTSRALPVLGPRRAAPRTVAPAGHVAAAAPPRAARESALEPLRRRQARAGHGAHAGEPRGEGRGVGEVHADPRVADRARLVEGDPAVHLDRSIQRRIHFFGDMFRHELFDMAGRCACPELYYR